MAERTLIIPPQSVYTKGSTSTALFHPGEQVLETNEVHDLRVSFDLRQNSGDVAVRPGFQMSNDGETWDTAVEFAQDFTTTAGHTYGSEFIHFPSLATRKRWVRFGTFARNDATTNVEFARCEMRIDMESRLPDIALQTVDVTNYKASVNPNSMTFSVTDQGSGVHRVSLTGDNNIRDGSSEGVQSAPAIWSSGSCPRGCRSGRSC